MSELGQRMFSQNIVLRGRLSERNWRDFLQRAVRAIGLTSNGDIAVWNNPRDAEQASASQTICGPLIGGFVVLDYWDDHDGAYLHISSCKRFDVAALVEPAREFCLAVEFLGRAEALVLQGGGLSTAARQYLDCTDPAVLLVEKGSPEAYHWETAEKARKDGYLEFWNGSNILNNKNK